ncbi:MAG: DUF262 domain-containing protein [Chitinophagales bacterium]
MGEKLTFHKLVSEKNYIIEIPIIQRDYVQGRDTASEIRLQFLTTLNEYLSENKSIELDFIYGSLVENESKILFTPLDGQQRLTTLFLLHWYLSVKENRLSEFQEILSTNGRSKFSYETRITSRDFCNALISNDIKFSEFESKLISDVISDLSWFFLSWKNDPTIQSMLVVLDEINIVFHDSNEFYDKLISSDNPIICFQFIQLENFGLTDSLYVKMNSRGKELTEFENFKAKFEQYLEKADLENNTNFKIEFSQKIDKEWTDLFWNYRNAETNLFDNELMNFIRVLVTNNYVLVHSTSYEFEINIKELTDRFRKVSFKRYEELKCLNIQSLKDIMGTLEYLKNGSNEIKLFLSDNTLIDESKLFKKVVQNQLTYTDRILFFSLYKYLIFNNGSINGLYDWMRIIRNLAVNSIYNNADEFAKSIKKVNLLLPHSGDILKYFSNHNFKIEGFAEIQFFEERIKATLIMKSNEWREVIIRYEDHKYFEGQIDFILKFCGIKEFFKLNDNLDWDSETNNIFFSSFINYAKKSEFMFVEYGLKEYDNYLWQRALLSKGDYLLWPSKNKSFLINDDRDISWKRYLRDDTPKREILKLLFDEFNINSASKDLHEIIDNDCSEDWRKYFIKRPEIIKACGAKKYIRWESNDDILLLERSQTNGWHREYYSYALKIKLENSGYTVSYTCSNSVENPKYINKINNIEIEIKYSFFDDGWNYEVITYACICKYFKTEDEVINYLIKENIIRG